MNKFGKFAFVLVAAIMTNSFILNNAIANEAFCADHLKYGAPSNPNNENIKVCREGYALMFNIKTKTPIWVVEHLKNSNVFGSATRAAKFKPDPEIPTKYQAKASDYKKTGFDQGHMAPAADFSQNQQLMDESFYFSNVVPQVADNNRHIWASLEKKIRTWLDKRQDLYVITGPVFKGGKVNQVMGRSEVAIPDYLYKIVYDPKTQNSISFLVPNQELEAKELPKFIATISDVEKATGLNFISIMDAKSLAELKNKKSGMWNR